MKKIQLLGRTKCDVTLFILIICVVAFVSYPAIEDVIYSGHDLYGLCGRIEGIKSAWECGQVFPVIMPNAYNGYGYLEFMYPELFLLVPAYLRYIGVSMVTSLHVYIVLINAVTAFFAYFGIKSVLDNYDTDCMDNNRMKIISGIAACFYLMAQYRLADIYIRAAIGEAVSMAFLPMVISGLYNVLEGDRKKWWILVIGMSGILNSHILTCALIVPVLVIFTVFYIKNILKGGRWKEIIVALAVFVIVNSWYIVPFVRFYLFGLNTDALIVDDVYNHAVAVGRIFSMSSKEMGQDYFLLSMGISSLLVIILTFTGFIINSDRKNWMANGGKLLFTVVFIFGIYLTLSLEEMPFIWLRISYEKIYSILSMLQFPYRLLTIVTVCLMFMLALSIYRTEIFRENMITIGAVIMIMCIMGSGNLMSDYKGYMIALDKQGIDFEQYVPRDYLPKGIQNDVFEDTDVYIDSQDATVKCEKNGTNVTLYYESSENTTCNIPLLYYPCYSATDETGNKIDIFQCDNKRLGLCLPEGNHVVKLKVKLY